MCVCTCLKGPHVCMHACMCVHVGVSMRRRYVHAYMFIDVCVHAYIHICMRYRDFDIVHFGCNIHKYIHQKNTYTYILTHKCKKCGNPSSTELCVSDCLCTRCIHDHAQADTCLSRYACVCIYIYIYTIIRVIISTY